jgi:hypothetical protein
LSAALPADCTVCVTAGPTGAGTCEVTEVTALTAVSTGVGRGEGEGLGCGDGLGEGEPVPGPPPGRGCDDPDPPAADIGRVVTPPGAIVPPVEARPFEGIPRGVDTAGATRVRPPLPLGCDPLGTVRAIGIAPIAAPAVRAVAAPSASGPALGAGGPENTWPSTPSWLKPPPSASATSAAIIAHGTISAALEAANS